ncbi:hypothetical protein GIB67_023646, partial [Kingdonia uniflora]
MAVVSSVLEKGGNPKFEFIGVITEVPEIILRCISRDEAALAVAQKVYKSLYENASDSTHIRVHLSILSAIRDVCKLVVKELTSWNNMHMAKLLDSGRNKDATEFSISLLQILVAQEPGISVSELHNLLMPWQRAKLIDSGRNSTSIEFHLLVYKGVTPLLFYRKVQQAERGEFSASTTPTGFDHRDPFDMGGPRMFNSTHQDMILRRKLEEAEVQQALELQSRRLMGLQLLDIKKLLHHQRNMSSEICGSPHSIIVEKNVMNDEKKEFLNSNNHDDYDFHNSSNSNNIINSLEHNLPDSPFASPTKSGGDNHPFFTTITSETDKMSLSSSSSTSTTNNSLIPSSLLPTAATSTLDISSYKLCFFPIT